MNGDSQASARPRRAVLAPALEAVHDVLDAAGIWHCLAFGTLLGSVRGGALIPWDHDIDLWVRPGDREAILAIAQEDHVAFVARSFDAGQLAANPGHVASFDPGVFTIAFRGATVGELWAPTLFSDGVLRMFDLAAGVYFWPQSSMPHHHFGALESVEVAGRSYPVPADPATLLEWLYGEDWQTPVRAAADGGDPRPGHAHSGDRADARLAAWIAGCRAQGWDQGAYAAQPSWPRPILGGGPRGSEARASELSGSEWWRTVEELSADY